MINVSLVFVCLWSALMFGVGYLVHWLVTPKAGFIHIEQHDGDYDKFSIEFTRNPVDLYELHEVMLKIKFKDMRGENSPDSDST